MKPTHKNNISNLPLTHLKIQVSVDRNMLEDVIAIMIYEESKITQKTVSNKIKEMIRNRGIDSIYYYDESLSDATGDEQWIAAEAKSEEVAKTIFPQWYK